MAKFILLSTLCLCAVLVAAEQTSVAKAKHLIRSIREATFSADGDVQMNAAAGTQANVATGSAEPSKRSIRRAVLDAHGDAHLNTNSGGEGQGRQCESNADCGGKSCCEKKNKQGKMKTKCKKQCKGKWSLVGSSTGGDDEEEEEDEGDVDARSTTDKDDKEDKDVSDVGKSTDENDDEDEVDEDTGSSIDDDEDKPEPDENDPLPAAGPCSTKLTAKGKVVIDGWCQTFSYCQHKCRGRGASEIIWRASCGLCRCGFDVVLEKVRGPPSDRRRRSWLAGPIGCSRPKDADAAYADSQVLNPGPDPRRGPKTANCSKVFGEDTGMEGEGGRCATNQVYKTFGLPKISNCHHNFTTRWGRECNRQMKEAIIAKGVGQRVRCRNSSEKEWLWGVVTSINPLKVQPEGPEWKEGLSWNQVEEARQKRSYRNCHPAACQQKCRDCKDSEECGFECTNFNWSPSNGVCSVFTTLGGATKRLQTWFDNTISGSPSCKLPGGDEYAKRPPEYVSYQEKNEVAGECWLKLPWKRGISCRAGVCY